MTILRLKRLYLTKTCDKEIFSKETRNALRKNRRLSAELKKSIEGWMIEDALDRRNKSPSKDMVTGNGSK